MKVEDESPGGPPPEEETQAGEVGETPLLQEQIEEALREKDQFRTMAQRAQADLLNYKNRALGEMEELRRSTNSQLLLKMLNVVDDLERAISLIPQDAVAPGWLDGLNLVLRNINQTLDAEGVSKIEAQGRNFEPWELEAVQYKETADAEEGKVIEVIRDGYKYRDKVLRAAQVIVAKKPEGSEAQPETTEEEAE
ncbi:MAG: nucleotide exchange factor GrpE [Dehalococcoidia bacterium]|nr:nucleotide exchange factor GrpE [Dehalococcoidia bacterium]